MSTETEYTPSPSEFVRDQVAEYEASGGTRATTLRGQPVVILTTRGAQSGTLRKTPLMRVEHDGSYAVVASQGGAPAHPAWYHNLRAEPRVWLQDGPDRREYVAHEATGAEKQQWWDRAVQVWPDYDDYQQKTDREVPLLVLDPVA